VFLQDERRQRIYEVPFTGARLGREPDIEMVFPDEETLVSAVHARVFHKDDGTWWLEDLGSTNGTWIGSKRVTEPIRLRTGDRFTFGQRGPVINVNIPGELKRTQTEKPVDVSQPLLRLRRVKGGEDLIANGAELVLGRAADCAIPLRTVADTMVSKHHAVVEIVGHGEATVRDLGSKNGTWVNGAPVTADAPLKVGDRIMLGWHGPLFEVRIIGAAMMVEGEGAEYRPRLQPPKTFGGMVQSARDVARGDTGVRLTAFARSMGRQMLRESSAVFRVAVLVLFLGLAGAIGYVWSVTARRALDAEERLASAEREFSEQLRSATASQLRSDAEIRRLTRELLAARRNAMDRTVLDSLTRQLRLAQAAAQGPDFTRIATENQRAVGLVVARFGGDSTMGSGFVITRSGYLITNRHVVQDPERPPLRSVEVTMADTRMPLPADVVSVSTVNEQDIAVLKVRGFRGEPVRAIDWMGRDIRQGSAAALIGFPGGIELAIDPRGYVRTSIFPGIISKMPGDWLQFGGTTLSGSSGSPIFNATGAVIAVHFGGYRGGPGVGFSVPVARVRRWLPADARAELGI
jgi:pSer/pThr/pTyr-binding forkhead associated (FHA) protein/S1-C subfamily serine protease